MQIKPGITADGFRTAVRDYTESTVVEELGANSYDADASTLLVLLDTDKNHLYIIDDGVGFNADAFINIATLGAGNKRDIPYSTGKRHYLGSYGYGVKSTLNIASKIEIESYSASEKLKATIDWDKLDEALKEEKVGFPYHVDKNRKKYHGTQIKLTLKNPTTKAHLDKYGEVLSNLPSDKNSFICYFGNYRDVVNKLPALPELLSKVRIVCVKLQKQHLLSIAGSSLLYDLNSCEKSEIKDRIDKSVKAMIYFTGMQGDKVKSLKPGLRGIYVRIHGRLLKQSFTDRKYTYPISKWVKFENGLRIELEINWLRDQISLSREGVRFSNEKLEKDFKDILTRCVNAFIKPKLKKLESKKAKLAGKKADQRIELAKKRVEKDQGILIPGLSEGFIYRPETDGEMALVVSQPSILKRILPSYSLIDYNDQAPYDCILFDNTRNEYIKTELEPNLMAFLSHKEREDVQLIITWTRGSWRIGAKKNINNSVLSLNIDPEKRKGWYKLLEYSGKATKKPKKEYLVIVVEEALFDKIKKKR